MNIYRFSKEFSVGKYVPFLEAYCKCFDNSAYYEQILAVLSLLDKAGLKALPLEGEKWYEIDDMQDLDIAETLFGKKEGLLPGYQKRYGGYWRFPFLLDFAYLVNPHFPTERMLEELKANFDKLLRQYFGELCKQAIGGEALEHSCGGCRGGEWRGRVDKKADGAASR